MPERNQADSGDRFTTFATNVHCAIMAIDIADFGHPQRSDDVQLHLRSTLYQILREAFDASAVPWDTCYHEDRGDGVFIITPSETSDRLMDPLLLRLTAGVRRHNRISSGVAQLRLRVAVHVGYVHFDELGVIGSAVIRVFRLLDSATFKKKLSKSEAEVGLIVSDAFYDDVVRHGLGMLDPEDFEPLRVRFKETETRGWVRILGPQLPSHGQQARAVDVSLYVRDVGEGTPLVLLHAYPLSSAMWLAQREELAKRFRVVTPDLRGFGGSILGADEPSVDVMADDVAAMLRSKGIDQAVIGGLGMGGYVAMALWRRHTHRVLGLVLANTTASADSPETRQRRLDLADRIEAENSVDALTDELLPQLIGRTTLRQRALVYGRVKGLVQSTVPSAAAWAQRAIAARPDAFETLRTIRSPSLVIAGAEDILASRDDTRAMVEAIPSARLTVIPRCGHLTAVEQPDLFNQIVAEFVTSLASTLR